MKEETKTEEEQLAPPQETEKEPEEPKVLSNTEKVIEAASDVEKAAIDNKLDLLAKQEAIIDEKTQTLKKMVADAEIAGRSLSSVSGETDEDKKKRETNEWLKSTGLQI